MPEKALVTGEAGFIGLHPAEQLLDRAGRSGSWNDLTTGAHRNVDALRKPPSLDLDRILADVIEPTRRAPVVGLA